MARRPAAAPASPAQWKTLGDVPEGSFCVFRGKTIRVTAHIGCGTYYRDEAGDGPFCRPANTPLVGAEDQ